MGPSGHELVDHTSEVTLRIHAPTFEGVLEEAARAFLGLAPARIRGEPTVDEREFRLDAPDRAALLVDWLNELVYLGEAERWLPREVRAEALGPGGVRIHAAGLALSEPFVLVKAATLHGAVVRDVPDGVRAEVTLDV